VYVVCRYVIPTSGRSEAPAPRSPIILGEHEAGACMSVHVWGGGCIRMYSDGMCPSACLRRAVPIGIGFAFAPAVKGCPCMIKHVVYTCVHGGACVRYPGVTGVHRCAGGIYIYMHNAESINTIWLRLSICA